jgi:hypothetical protein
VLAQLGPRLLLSWAGHFAALAAYTLGHVLLSPLRPLAARSWHLRRLLDALEYGSGCDHGSSHTPDHPRPPPGQQRGAGDAAHSEADPHDQPSPATA